MNDNDVEIDARAMRKGAMDSRGTAKALNDWLKKRHLDMPSYHRRHRHSEAAALAETPDTTHGYVDAP